MGPKELFVNPVKHKYKSSEKVSRLENFIWCNADIIVRCEYSGAIEKGIIRLTLNDDYRIFNRHHEINIQIR